MSGRPVIGIACCNRVTGGEASQSVMTRYVAATMRHADAAALLIPALPELMHPHEVAPRLDALLLTGSPSNVGAERYGDDGGEGPFDPGRDGMVLGLIDAMLARGRPVFGICRGFQELNVAFGGTLRRDLGAAHHAPDDAGLDAMFAYGHEVTLALGGQLAAAYGVDRLHVNSVHYQGVARLGAGLTIEAVASDGVTEAFSATVGAAAVLAVQWHPEWQTDANPDSQRFFGLLGTAARG